MAKSQLEALRESVHAIRMFERRMRERLECRRCNRILPDDQFSPVFGTKYARNVRGAAGEKARWVQYLHPWCHSCKKQSVGQCVNHPSYSPEIDRFWQKRMNAIKANALSRGIMMLMDKDDFLRICLDQSNKCAVTGLPMTFHASDITSRRLQASADRINSDGNYSINNVQIVCAVVNTMKSDMSTKEFLRWCALVLNGRTKVEDELLSAIG